MKRKNNTYLPHTHHVISPMCVQPMVPEKKTRTNEHRRNIKLPPRRKEKTIYELSDGYIEKIVVEHLLSEQLNIRRSSISNFHLSHFFPCALLLCDGNNCAY